MTESGRDGLLLAGHIASLDPESGGTAIWWEHGRIRAVGAPRLVARMAPAGVPVYDLPDALVTPGLVDSHTHFAMWALGRRQVQLQGARSAGEAATRVALAEPVDGWVLGQGWDANDWPEPPDRRPLDAVQPVPIFLSSLDVHAAWVNSAALAAAGIGPETADPVGGKIVRDAAGHPTGLLLERAVELVSAVLPQPPADRLIESLDQAQREAHRLGITGIHDVETHLAYNAFHALDAEDRLRLRVLFHHPVAELDQVVSRGIRSGAGGPWLTHGGIKMFLDGSLGKRTAWMLDPYERSRDRGMPITAEATAREAMTLAARSGLASVVHAIGDAAVRRALDLMEDLPRAVVAHRIEHFQCVHPADLGRAAAAGIVLSMQPAHLLTDIPLADRHWGARSAGAYAFRSLAERGSVLAFGSDAPVASLDPREGIFAATERARVPGDSPWYPGERLTLEAAIRAYTVGPAMAAGVAHRRGRLAPGMDADLVAWDWVPRTGAEFRDAKVRLTVAGGEAVYTSPSP